MKTLKISSHEQQGQVRYSGNEATVLFGEKQVTKTNEDNTTYIQWEYIGVVMPNAKSFVDVVEVARGYAKKFYQESEIAKGCVTSVLDSEGKPIVMQCGQNDILLLSNSPLKTMVQDINNVVHQITEAQFETILNDIRVKGLQIWQQSQLV